jgi:ABC transporter substrate binding protein
LGVQRLAPPTGADFSTAPIFVSHRSCATQEQDQRPRLRYGPQELAALVVLSQLEVEALTVHSHGDVADAGPGVEPGAEGPFYCSARAAKDATHTIPIVLMAVPDVVEHGLVDSLARPGGNITGTSIPVYDLTIKQLQVLKEINPRLQRIVVVQGDRSRGDRHMVDRLQVLGLERKLPLVMPWKAWY